MCRTIRHAIDVGVSPGMRVRTWRIGKSMLCGQPGDAQLLRYGNESNFSLTGVPIAFGVPL